MIAAESVCIQEEFAGSSIFWGLFEIQDFGIFVGMTEMNVGCVKGSQKLVSSTYQTKMGPITVTWCRGLMGQGLGLFVQLAGNRKVQLLSPWRFWKKKHGSRLLELPGGSSAGRGNVFWDLSSAKFRGSGPEPIGEYYLAVVWENELALLLGDMQDEAMKRDEIQMLSCCRHPLVFKREHVLGKKQSFSTVASFGNGERCHELCISIAEPELVIAVDGETAIEVRHLSWKFRGNGTINVGGVSVHVFWDVHDWLFRSAESRHHKGHRAVFIFQYPSSSSSAAAAADCEDAEDVSHDCCFQLYAWKL